MKIVQALAWYFPENLGGTEVYVQALAQRLRAAGHQVLIAAPDANAATERTYEHDGFPVHRYPIPAQATRAEVQGTVVVRGAEKFHVWLGRQKADIVHIHTFSTGLGLHEVNAARESGARVVVTTHSSSLGFLCQRGTMMRWGEYLCDGICEPGKCAACELQRRGLPRALAPILATLPLPISRIVPGKLGTALGMRDLIARNRAMQAQMLAAVDEFVVLTQWARDVVIANGAPPAKVSLNRLGHHLVVERKAGPAERPTAAPVRVGYLGRFEDVKGVHDLARALVHLPRSVAIRVEFRGPDSHDAERRVLSEVRAIVGGDPRCKFAPAVAADQVPSVLAGYDVLCCPAVCLEGGPTVAIEAHAVGTPVIGTHIGGLAEMVADGVNGRLVPPGDWQALAEVLQGIAADPAGTVDRWRGALPGTRTMNDVAADYERTYAALLHEDGVAAL